MYIDMSVYIDTYLQSSKENLILSKLSIKTFSLQIVKSLELACQKIVENEILFKKCIHKNIWDLDKICCLNKIRSSPKPSI